MRVNEVAKSIHSGKWNVLETMKKIDFDSGKFEANGTTYYLESKLNVSRYCEFQILQAELSMGMTLKEIYDSMFTNRDLLNQMRFVDAAVFTDKLIMHTAKLKHKEPTVLKLCTLFINTENEDRSIYNNDMVVKKLADWKAENIDVEDFFAIALTLAPGFIEIYNNFTQNIMAKMEVAQEFMNSAVKIHE